MKKENCFNPTLRGKDFNLYLGMSALIAGCSGIDSGKTVTIASFSEYRAKEKSEYLVNSAREKEFVPVKFSCGRIDAMPANRLQLI